MYSPINKEFHDGITNKIVEPATLFTLFFSYCSITIPEILKSALGDKYFGNLSDSKKRDDAVVGLELWFATNLVSCEGNKLYFAATESPGEGSLYHNYLAYCKTLNFKSVGPRLFSIKVQNIQEQSGEEGTSHSRDPAEKFLLGYRLVYDHLTLKKGFVKEFSLEIQQKNKENETQ